MARDRSPQEKKAAALAKDRRNTYGENDKSSRKSIRRRKRLSNHTLRQAFRQAIHREALATGDVAVPRHVGWWRKSADTPLGEVLHWRRVRRLLRALGERFDDDPGLLDELERAAIDEGLAEVEARMVLRAIRGFYQPGGRGRGELEKLSAAACEVFERLTRRLARGASQPG